MPSLLIEHPEAIIAPRMRRINIIHFLSIFIFHPLSSSNPISSSLRPDPLEQRLLSGLKNPLSGCNHSSQIPLSPCSRTIRHCSTHREPFALPPVLSDQRPTFQRSLSDFLRKSSNTRKARRRKRQEPTKMRQSVSSFHPLSEKLNNKITEQLTLMSCISKSCLFVKIFFLFSLFFVI